jgi:hypothetical protein
MISSDYALVSLKSAKDILAELTKEPGQELQQRPNGSLMSDDKLADDIKGFFGR